MTRVNEWTFTADVAKWIEEILREHIDIPFSRAEVEERGEGTRKRRDLTLYHRNGQRLLTGEIKMPDTPEGRTPLEDTVVRDAHAKADNIGIEFFFTWNVNHCVLWKTFKPGTPITERDIEHYRVLPAPIRHAEEIEHPRVQERIREFLVKFLNRCAAVTSGEEPMMAEPLDERFLWVWEAALEQPVALTLRALSERYEQDPHFTKKLDDWMRDDQKWDIQHSEDVVRDNLERSAKLSCYVLANKLIFYKALRRRFTRMRALQAPTSVETGADLQELFDQYFEHAAAMSRDYETVFRGDFGDTLPFLNDLAVGSWRELVRQTDSFDFTQLDYEIIGQVFERMLSTGERHKFGQHYTRSEVVDLINTFCIRDPQAVVMDPACGGGTFLVRAYARKKDLSGGNMKHQELIQQLYGIDISAYPAHLTTINLATRDLIDKANYPLVAREDFFKLHLDDAVFQVPLGSEDKQIVALQVGKVDAIVGNPPYVRQEKISEYYGKKYKALLREQALRDAPGSDLSGRSDIHCFFFTHGMPFLNDDGYIGLLTSSTWLDTTYGFRLQRFLLDNFEIIAVFESNCEPWFTGARVTTAATILRRQKDPEKRAANRVKFVLLTKPLGDLLAYSTTEEDRRLTFEELRKRVEAMHGTATFSAALSGREPVEVGQEHLEGMRIRIVRQDDLYSLGCSAVPVSEADEESDEEQGGAEAKVPESTATGYEQTSDYTGFKWGLFLRAPDVFFKLLRTGGRSFVPLAGSGVADVARGITSGCDTFFFPRDISEQYVQEFPDPSDFRAHSGISARALDRYRVLRAGDGTVHAVEKEYVRPVVFNLMEISTAEVRPEQLSRRVITVGAPKDDLRGTRILKYIRWGERQNFHDGSTCAGRERWYDLGRRRVGDMLWTMAQRYRHIVPVNTPGFVCNHNLFDIMAAPGMSEDVLAAVLNSTVVALCKHQFGRTMGGDPMLKTEVVDVKMMLVPDPRLATEPVRNRLSAALESLKRREIGHLVAVDASGDEPSGDLAMSDRQELDDAVLELIGITDPAERLALREELYLEVTRMYRAIRAAEKKMQAYRSRNARKGRPTARSIAAEIWESFETKPEYRTVLDFTSVDAGEIVDLPEGKAAVIVDLFNSGTLRVGKRDLDLRERERAEFGKALVDSGVHGPVSIPLDPTACAQAVRDCNAFLDALDEEFSDMAGGYTSDENLQQKIVRELWRLLRNQRGS